MKIVHVIGYFQPEYGYEEYYTAKEQVKLGHDVHVVCSDRIVSMENMGIKERKRPIGFSEYNGIKVHRLKTIMEPYSDFVFIKGLGKKLKQLKPDVVHGHTLTQPPSILSARYKDKLGFKYVIDDHDFFFHGHPMNPIKKDLKRFFARMEYLYIRRYMALYALKKADKVVAVADVCKEHLLNFFKLDEKKIFLNRLAVDMDRFEYDESSRNEIRKKYGFKDKDVVLVFTGIVSERKRVDMFLDILKSFDSSVKLLMVIKGDEGYINSIESMFVDNKLSDRVVIVKNIESNEIKKYYSATDIAVWPNNNSVAILEAMACKLPIVVPRLQLSYYIEDNGFVFQPENIAEGIDKLKNLVSNPALRKQFGEKSFLLANEKSSYRAFAIKLINLYKNI